VREDVTVRLGLLCNFADCGARDARNPASLAASSLAKQISGSVRA
jgi:hypothetical protein